MVNARLHVICGNCGAIATNGMMTHQIREGDEDAPQRVLLSCANCATLHNLSDTVPASR